MSTLTIKFNGERISIAHEMTLVDLLESQNIEQGGIAIAVNQQVQTKAMWSDTRFNEGDDVVVFRAIAGG
ncbi:sulfur carrier protein ThiS [Vibrio sp. S9_S30]|uniref:sulfur carrier protein ThiS n=1 Tax=Vibrio sp. S9_S30 TaxID=2720226 RepID=UPI0016819163|nr:sulfur carrier protein ThiS [Vibrio sp. S9_S30]MBD1559627.1 sulfur carrier protein ThiS [Vibrio sp. S9_S30]